MFLVAGEEVHSLYLLGAEDDMYRARGSFQSSALFGRPFDEILPRLRGTTWLSL